MFCKKCGKELPDNSLFCSGCGMDLNENKNPPLGNKQKTMCTINFFPEKSKAVLTNVEIYIYIDEKMYVWNSKTDSDFSVKVTPEIHFIQASMYKKDARKKIDGATGITDHLGFMGGAGPIIGLAAHASAALTGMMMEAGDGITGVDCSDGKDVNLKIHINAMKKISITDIGG